MITHIPLEIEPQTQAPPVKATPKPTLMGILPLPVDDPEGDVLVRRSRAKMQQHGILVSGFFDNLVRGRLGLIYQIGVEYVELVALDNFGGWVVGANQTWEVSISTMGRK